MKIAVLGAGFTGLTAAYRLLQKGHDVTVFEKDSLPGGLAVGYRENGWEWTLEKHYHHWFTNTKTNINNDKAVFALAQEINHGILIKRPKTSIFVDDAIYQFDSPKDVLLFKKLSLLDRIRMGLVFGALKFDPFWKPLEKVNASTFLPKAIGKKSYNMIWKPQLVNKFGKYIDDVSLAWFWARLASRTPNLAYPKGGFLEFANNLVSAIKQHGGVVKFNTEVTKVTDREKTEVTYANKTQLFDSVIVTLPFFLFLKIFPQLPDSYKNRYHKLKSLGATNIILRLKKPFFPDNTYWLSVCDLHSPVMAIVEHTNFMDKAHYNNEHLVYLGNYLSPDDPRFLMTKEEQLSLFDPFLRKINPEYKKNLIGYQLFKAPFAQPIIPTNYSKIIPPTTTPLQHVFLANIDQVYPWDRGTSNAVALGNKVASVVL